MNSLQLRLFLALLLFGTWVECNFERTHNDYDPNPLKMELGWGAIHCIDFQEVSTLWRPVTFEPALVVNCELKSHQCITIRAVNGTHYYTFQGCLPQARVSKMCTELAYEASINNGAEYFYCYDVSYDRLNVPANVPLAGRECCCNGDFCNRIENVVTIDTMIPHDQLLSIYARHLHLWYWNALRLVGICSAFATIFFWFNMIYIILKPAETEDDSAWYLAPVHRNQLTADPEDDDDEADAEQDVPVLDAVAQVKPKEEIEASKKKKKANKKKTTKEEIANNLQTEKTQECSQEDQLPAAKTGDDKEDDKKSEKKASKETTEKEKKEETPTAAKETKTQEVEPKKEEKEGEGTQFKLCKPKKLANGRVQYVSMFNEDSDYDDD